MPTVGAPIGGAARRQSTALPSAVRGLSETHLVRGRFPTARELGEQLLQSSSVRSATPSVPY